METSAGNTRWSMFSRSSHTEDASPGNARWSMFSRGSHAEADSKRTPLRRSKSEMVLASLKNRHWGARHCFPCLENHAESTLYKLYKEVGEEAVDDARYDLYDFSLFKGTYFVGDSTETVEMNGTDADPLDEDGIKMAIVRFKAFYHPLIPLGCILYALTLGGGFLSGYFCDCSDGPGLWGFAFPVVAIAILVYWLEKLTVLMSQTEIEGRPLLLLLKSMEGIDNYHILSVLTCLDVFSRFTRAQFVGYMQHCHGPVDEGFDKAYEHHGMLGRFMGDIGIAGLSAMSFILGPLVIQFGYMFWLIRKFQVELDEANTKQAGETLDITDSLDDLGALAEWAMLKPMGKVMELASVPIELRSAKDVDRLWDRTLTQCLVAAARNIPDGILQMELQSWFLCLVFPGIDWTVKAQLVFNIVLAGVGVLGDSVDLLLANRRVTVGTALILLGMMLFGVSRTIMAFYCPSTIESVGFELFHCIPKGMIAHGNWTSGTLPG